MSRLKQDECRAGWHRKTGFLSILLTGLYCLAFLLISPLFGRFGTGTAPASEYELVAFNVFLTFLLPCLLLFGTYMKFRGWEKSKQEKLHKWQANWSLFIIICLCL